MLEYVISANSIHLASAYGEGSFNSETYNGNPTAAPETNPETTVPTAPNTGFFQSAFSGASEMSLIPIILVIAIAAGAITVGVRKLLRKNSK